MKKTFLEYDKELRSIITTEQQDKYIEYLNKLEAEYPDLMPGIYYLVTWSRNSAIQEAIKQLETTSDKENQK